MTFRAYRPERRLARRRWFFIVVTLMAITSVVVYLVSRQTEQRGAVEFIAASDQASDISDAAATELEDALFSIGVLDRQELARRLQSVSEAATAANVLLDIEVPSNIGRSFGTMATATASWELGTKKLELTIAAMMDGDLLVGATAELQKGFDLLGVGDNAYRLFLASLTSIDEDVDVLGFSPVAYILPELRNPLAYDAQSLAIRIITSYDLSPHGNVAVNGSTVPAPIGESDDGPVVPYATSIDIQTVVSNTGNQDEATVEVVMDALNIGTDVTVSLSKTVTDLAAGTSTTVTFTDVDIQPGSVYEVKVTARIENDIDPEDNVWEMRFVWRDQS